MEFDLSAVETATLVFIGTLVFALALVLFVTVAATLLGLVHGINHLWDRLVHHASAVELPGDFQGQPSPSTGTYPRVALRDS